MLHIVEHQPSALSSYSWSANILECRAENGVVMKVEVCTSDILRFRYATEGFFLDDFSYAIDPSFMKSPVNCVLNEESDYLELITDTLKCRVARKDLKISVYDKAGFLINQDERGFHWEYRLETGNEIVKMSKSTKSEESFFGLGDKPMNLNIRGKKVQNWSTDSYGYVKGTDPLYKNIPFYYGLHQGVGYGIFFDNSFKTFFDFAHERTKVTSFWAQGGEMNYYFIGGPSLLDVARRYTDLTGKPQMPAMWALGFQQCKWSYYPEETVRAIAAKMRSLKIPCDAIYLDIDYMDGFRCFTWDNEKFPDPVKMVSDLRNDGFKTVVIIDPGIKKDMDYAVFKEALEQDFFCRRPDGPYVEGIVWPGDCYFPDFTRPEVRAWWSGLYRSLIEEVGVAGVWNDMNEPALFEVSSKTFPDDVRHDYDGHHCSHLKAHNIYGMQMARATAEGVRRFSDGKRPLIISRSGYAGLQRFSSVWTGDNCATWEHLWLANIQCQRLSISGVSFTGSDIGGFVGAPTSEMFIRWIQLGIFHPFCRVHSSQDDGDQEPWSFGTEALDLFREAVELRYRLLPYHYTAFYQCHRQGTPILRPLVFFDQEDGHTHSRDNEFLCGDHILTCSVCEADKPSLSVYLPKGLWYSFWNDGAQEGGKTVDVELTKSTFPFFIRGGAVIPFYPVQQYVDQKNIQEVELRLYYKHGQEVSGLYEDAHDGDQYEEGEFRYSTFVLEGSAKFLSLRHELEGTFIPSYERFLVTVVGLPFKPSQIEVDGVLLDAGDIRIPSDFKVLEIRG